MTPDSTTTSYQLWATFFAQYSPLKLAKKTIFIHPFDQISTLYYLEEGFVKQSSVSQTGQELTLQLYKPQSYFYFSWLAGQPVSYYFFETLTAVVIRKAPLTAVRKFLDEQPQVLRDFNQRVFRGIDQVLFRMEALAFGTAITKVCAALLLLMKRFGKVTAQGVVIELPVTHQELALLSALTRETVSVEMSQLRKQQVIDRHQGKLVIKDEAYLRAQVPYQIDR